MKPEVFLVFHPEKGLLTDDGWTKDVTLAKRFTFGERWAGSAFMPDSEPYALPLGADWANEEELMIEPTGFLK